MSFPKLDSLLAKILPSATALWDGVKQRAFGKPRNAHMTLRHWDNQGGLSITEDGEVALRAGHTLYDDAVGASLSLTADGHVVITAPAGLILSGGSLFTTASPTDALAFQGGRLRLHSQWEKRVLVGAVLDDESVFDGLYVSATPGGPADIPLSKALRLTALYQRTQDYYG